MGRFQRAAATAEDTNADEVSAHPEASETKPQAEATPVAPSPEPKRYRVANREAVTILYEGCVTKLAPGRVIDDRSYDVAHLKRQGVVLTEFTAEG